MGRTMIPSQQRPLPSFPLPTEVLGTQLGTPGGTQRCELGSALHGSDLDAQEMTSAGSSSTAQSMHGVSGSAGGSLLLTDLRTLPSPLQGSFPTWRYRLPRKQDRDSEPAVLSCVWLPDALGTWGRVDPEVARPATPSRVVACP